MTRPTPTNRQALHDLALAVAVRAVCDGHPPYSDRSFWGQPCPACGSERTPPWSTQRAPVCPCEAKEVGNLRDNYIRERTPEVALEIWERSGVPVRFREAGFEGFEPRPGTDKAVAASRRWAEGFSLDTQEGLFYSGGFGSGKTHIAVATLRRAVERKLPGVVFESSGSLLAKVRCGDKLDWGPVERAIGAELLLLDDLGPRNGTDFLRDVVARVLFARYQDAKPTLITSNLGPKALTASVGGAIVSRIHEMTEPVNLTATDFRKKRGLGVA
jgi:DNA replication protein DnaC